MTLQIRYRIRQFVLDYLTIFLSFTAFILVLIAIRCWKFEQLGIDVLPRVRWPKHIDLKMVLDAFWMWEVAPLVKLLPLTLALDLSIRKVLLGKED